MSIINNKVLVAVTTVVLAMVSVGSVYAVSGNKSAPTIASPFDYTFLQGVPSSSTVTSPVFDSNKYGHIAFEASCVNTTDSAYYMFTDLEVSTDGAKWVVQSVLNDSCQPSEQSSYQVTASGVNGYQGLTGGRYYRVVASINNPYSSNLNLANNNINIIAQFTK